MNTRLRHSLTDRELWKLKMLAAGKKLSLQQYVTDTLRNLTRFYQGVTSEQMIAKAEAQWQEQARVASLEHGERGE